MQRCQNVRSAAGSRDEKTKYLAWSPTIVSLGRVDKNCEESISSSHLCNNATEPSLEVVHNLGSLPDSKVFTSLTHQLYIQMQWRDMLQM